MAAIGMGLIWFGYWASLSGVSLIKGWNNSPLGLANPLHVAAFSTKCYTGGGVFPTGNPGDSGPCSSAPPKGTTSYGGSGPASPQGFGQGAVGGGHGR